MEKNAIRVTGRSLRVDNSGDASRAYSIEATVETGAGGRVENANGSVYREGAQAASFSCWGGSDDNLSVNFQNVAVSQQCAVLTEVQGFMAAVRDMVAEAE